MNWTYVVVQLAAFAMVAALAYLLGRERGWDEGWDQRSLHEGALRWLDPSATEEDFDDYTERVAEHYDLFGPKPRGRRREPRPGFDMMDPTPPRRFVYDPTLPVQLPEPQSFEALLPDGSPVTVFDPLHPDPAAPQPKKGHT